MESKPDAVLAWPPRHLGAESRWFRCFPAIPRSVDSSCPFPFLCNDAHAQPLCRIALVLTWCAPIRGSRRRVEPRRTACLGRQVLLNLEFVEKHLGRWKKIGP